MMTHTGTRVAALFVIADGPYSGLDNVDPWDIDRDARTYRGILPVVAHPPCARWGKYWWGGPSAKVRRKKGDDDGCFASALESVQQWGGVLEHPEGSMAWRAHNIARPPRCGGWVSAGLFCPGWTCHIEQGHYGHPARKGTWLYCVGSSKPADLIWGDSIASEKYRLLAEYDTDADRRRAIKTGACQRLSKRQRKITPDRFRNLLISIAATSWTRQPATQASRITSDT